MDLFKNENCENLLLRIENLSKNSEKQWGNLSHEQMLAHCSKVLEVALKHYEKQLFIGKLFGKFAVKGILKNKTEMKRGIKSSKILFEEFPRSFEEEKERLTSNLKKFHEKGSAFFENKLHPFFGRLTSSEWSELTYKHLNHHLSQFSC